MPARNLIAYLYSFFNTEGGGQAHSEAPTKEITIGSSSTATKLDMAVWGGGSVQLGTDHASVAIYACMDEDGSGTYAQAYDCDNVPLTLARGDTAPQELDPAVRKFPWIKLVSATEDTDGKIFKKC